MLEYYIKAILISGLEKKKKTVTKDAIGQFATEIWFVKRMLYITHIEKKSNRTESSNSAISFQQYKKPINNIY